MRYLRFQKEIHFKILQMNRVLFFFLVKTWTKFCEIFCSKAYDKARSSMLRVVNFPMRNKNLLSSFEIVSLNVGERGFNFLLAFSCCVFLTIVQHSA